MLFAQEQPLVTLSMKKLRYRAKLPALNSHVTLHCEREVLYDYSAAVWWSSVIKDEGELYFVL